MEHTSHTEHRKQTIEGSGERLGGYKKRAATAARIASLLRGTVYLGIAYLLGTCPLPFGGLPLGFSILCAAQSMLPYLSVGLFLSCLHPLFPLPFWAGWLIYGLTLGLRFLFARLANRPSEAVSSQKERAPSAITRLTHLAEGFFRGDDTQDGDIMTDYYCGKKNTPVKVSVENIFPEADTEAAVEINRSPYKESTALRAMTATVGAFILGLWRMIADGFEIYDLLGFLVMLVAAPLFTYLLSFAFLPDGQALLFSSGTPDALPRQKNPYLLERFSFMTLCSALLLIFLCAMGSRQHILSLYSPYLDFRLAPILVLILSLRTTAGKGVIPGMIVAIVGGLGADPMMSPAFILAAMAYGALRFISHKTATVGGCLAALFWTIAGGGTENLVAYLPSMLISIPICLLFQKLSTHFPPVDKPASDPEAMNDFATAMEEKTRTEAHRARLEALSGAFTSLSQMFNDLSGRLCRPQMPELQRMCNEVFDRHCIRCRHRSTCDKAVCHPADLLSAHLSRQLFNKGKADLGVLPPETASACIHLSAIIEDVNTRCAKMTEHLLKSEKTQVFADEYESVADIINDTLDDDDFRSNREAADKIFDWLTGHGVTVLGVVVCGKRNCRIIVRGSHFDKSEPALRLLQSEFEDICATRLTAPLFESEAENPDTSVMRLSSSAMYDTVYAGSTVPADLKEGESLPSPLTNSTRPGEYLPPATCGDHIAMFKSENACFYALISDGMGSGEDASLTSDICALFLEKMLSAGNRVELSVRMLNSFIRQKNRGTGDECSATVDLMELDLMSGQAIFAKNGAAPSYVVRGGKVYKIRSRTLPIGILKDSDPQLLRFRMHPGDVVVMVSDGVTGGNDECPWLIELLSSPLPESMDSLRMDILRRAIASGSPDDLSAIAVRVVEH